MSNADKLRGIMGLNRLSYKDVADLFKHNSTATVRSWLLPADNKAHRNMPDEKIEVLALRISAINKKA